MSTKYPRRLGGGKSRRGEMVGPYQLEGRLGRGAMGEVFRAFDERLDRRVALKQVHAASRAGASARRRFLHEARAAARLNHPAIVQVHDILQLPDGDFIVMELAEGRSLGELLSGGPLPVPLALAYAADIAGGLAVAHAAGIVHRDLKKENIIVTPAGRPKILDFGLAKDLQPRGESTLSHEGQVIGTPRAMSPEQARGRAVDARADLFALGSLLYEMLTGIAPFDGASAAEALDKVCSLAPPPPSRHAEVSATVDALVMHLLEKAPSSRPQSAGWVQAELRKLLVEMTGDDDISSLTGLPYGLDGDLRHTGRRFSVVAAVFLVAIAASFAWWQPWRESEKVIAVARFETLGSGDRGFFSESLPDAIVAQLQGYEGVEARVIEVPTRQALEDMGAAYLVHGSIQWAFNDRVKVQPEISRVADGTVLWSDSFLQSIDDVPKLQDDVTRAVVMRVEEHLGLGLHDGGASEPLEPTGPAERFRINARIAAGGDSREEIERAITLLRHACEMESEDAAYWSDLAAVLSSARRRGLALEPSILAGTKAAAARAIELAPESAWTWMATGSFMAARGDLSGALEAYGASSSKASGSLRAELGVMTSWVLRRQGDSAGARSRLLKLLEEGRPAPQALAALAGLEGEFGLFESARVRLMEALRDDPQHPDLLRAVAKLALAGGAGPGEALGELVRSSDGALPEGRLASFAAFLALADGQPETALRFLDAAPRLAYGDEQVLHRDLLAAWALRQLGKPSRAGFDAARRHLEAEVALTGDARAMVALGLVYLEVGRPDLARDLAEGALRSDQFRNDAVVGRGVAVYAAALLRRLGEVERAEVLRSEPSRASSPWARLIHGHPPWARPD